MILEVTANSSPDCTATAIPQTNDAVSTPSTFHDSNILQNTSATTWDNYFIAPDVLTDSLTFETATPSVCSVSSGGSVTRNAAGFGVVYVGNGGVSKRKFTLDMRDSGGQTATEFVSYTSGSIALACASEVLTLLSAGGDANYYSSVNHTTPAYPRNAACWLADVDLSAVSVANRDAGGSWRHTRAGVAITARHVAFANHYRPPVGAELRFTNAAGTVFTHTIQAYHGAVSSGDNVLDDLAVAVMTPALDASITPMKCAGSWVMQSSTPSGSFVSYYAGGLAAWIDQNKNCYATHIGNRTALFTSNLRTGVFNGTTYTDIAVSGGIEPTSSQTASPYLSDYASNVKTPVPGDSGSPVMLVLSGEPVLLWCWFTPTTGTPVYSSEALLNARIAAADAAAGVSTGYTVTVAPDPTA